MSNKILLDSSILIEYIKGTKTELLDQLMLNDFELQYNSIVASEFIFHFLAQAGNKSPLALKEGNAIGSVLRKSNSPNDFLSQFNYLNIQEPEIKFSIELMSEFNLLSNDSLIIANAFNNGISYIATYDPDFCSPCKKFNIEVISSIRHIMAKWMTLAFLQNQFV